MATVSMQQSTACLWLLLPCKKQLLLQHLLPQFGGATGSPQL
jgi:hypothetical protein